MAEHKMSKIFSINRITVLDEMGHQHINMAVKTPEVVKGSLLINTKNHQLRYLVVDVVEKGWVYEVKSTEPGLPEMSIHHSYSIDYPVQLLPEGPSSEDLLERAIVEIKSCRRIEEQKTPTVMPGFFAYMVDMCY